MCFSIGKMRFLNRNVFLTRLHLELHIIGVHLLIICILDFFLGLFNREARRQELIMDSYGPN